MPRKKAKAPYLGRLKLHWCSHDNLPVLDSPTCPKCKNSTIKFNVTPPGDFRPAFEPDLARIRATIDSTFGEGLGQLLLPNDNIYILNRTPGIDLSEEIIANGHVYGRFIYNVFKERFEFHPRKAGAQLLLHYANQNNIPLRHTIHMHDDSVPFIMDGKSILAPGITEFDPVIEKGDICIVRINDTYLTLAIAHVDGIAIKSMVETGYGKVAKNLKNQRSSLTITEILSSIIPQTWENVYEVNKTHMESIVQESTRFIQKTIRQHPENKIVVAYSGGKDSLCTLLLAYHAIGPKFHIFFADTGLELPETIENTHDVAKLLGMQDQLHIRNAHDTFWNLVDHFGPPGRDYRFCCHGLKAQRINEIIEDVAPDEKVLSFLGQRRYESFSRAAEQRVYVNSFIPRQIAAAPIKNWNAMEVWLYILHYPHIVNNERVKVPVNEMYYHEFERIGCYLCPASDIATLKGLRATHPDMMKKWDDWLNSYAEKQNLPEDWLKYGLWRFKNLNQQWKNSFEKHGIDYSSFGSKSPSIIQFNSSKTDSTITGKILLPMHLNELENLLQALPGKTSKSDTSLNYSSREIEFQVEKSGDFSIHHQTTEKTISKFINQILALILKTENCANCGVCEDICPQNIIRIEKTGSQFIPVIVPSTESPCIHCLKCISHCPLHQKIKEN
ncbi:MAG: phosphoadenosine phosphosulfate reductase domain-containing protein [Promethearchaeota archaeon]